MAVADEQEPIAFDAWWYKIGSGLAPRPGEEQEHHVRRVSRIAWQRGAYHAMTGNLTPPTH